jgi:hypothetical protein
METWLVLLRKTLFPTQTITIIRNVMNRIAFNDMFLISIKLCYAVHNTVLKKKEPLFQLFGILQGYMCILEKEREGERGKRSPYTKQKF